MMLRAIFLFCLAGLVSTLASASPICSSIIGAFSCTYDDLSRSESLVLCTNDALDTPILIVNNSLAHGVKVSQNTSGESLYESDFVSLVVSSLGDTAIFVNKQLGSSAHCTTQL